MDSFLKFTRYGGSPPFAVHVFPYLEVVDVGHTSTKITKRQSCYSKAFPQENKTSVVVVDCVTNV